MRTSMPCLSRNNRSVCRDVIARSQRVRPSAGPMINSATKHSSSEILDCFAEPVIGRRFAPTRWLAMTVSAPTGLLRSSNCGGLAG
jgi:hypothetical protein